MLSGLGGGEGNRMMRGVRGAHRDRGDRRVVDQFMKIGKAIGDLPLLLPDSQRCWVNVAQGHDFRAGQLVTDDVGPGYSARADDADAVLHGHEPTLPEPSWADAVARADAPGTHSIAAMLGASFVAIVTRRAAQRQAFVMTRRTCSLR